MEIGQVGSEDGKAARFALKQRIELAGTKTNNESSKKCLSRGNQRKPPTFAGPPAATPEGPGEDTT